MTAAELVLADFTEAEARSHTDKIRRGAERLWELVVEAHDRKAHKALGYKTFRDYVGSELPINRSRAPEIQSAGDAPIRGNGHAEHLRNFRRRWPPTQRIRGQSALSSGCRWPVANSDDAPRHRRERPKYLLCPMERPGAS